MYPRRGRADLVENGPAAQPVGDELTGLAAAASHAAATEAHTHSQLHQLPQEQHLAQQYQLSMSYQQAAMQLNSRTKDLIHANMPGNMPIPSSMMAGVPAMDGGAGKGKSEPPPSKARKRRQSQARLVQNAEAQKRYRNRLKQEKELMKESTNHLQKRVQMLEDHSRTLLEFGQDCVKRLSKLEAEAGWEPPEKDFGAALNACASALEPAEETATSAKDDQVVAGDALDEQARATQPTRAAGASAASDADSSAAADQSNIASLDQSTGVNYIYQMYKARVRDLYADVNRRLSELCGWDTDARKFKPCESRPQDMPDGVCTSAEVADKVVAVMKQFTAQKEAMRMQHQHEQLAFLQARYAKEYQNLCGQNEFQWPANSGLFRAALSIAKANGWVSPTEKRDSADLLAFVVHATARGVHREKEAALAAAATALRSATTGQGGL